MKTLSPLSKFILPDLEKLLDPGVIGDYKVRGNRNILLPNMGNIIIFSQFSLPLKNEPPSTCPEFINRSDRKVSGIKIINLVFKDAISAKTI